jgi:hypothetical protein
MICDGAFDAKRKSHAGFRLVPRSFYDIKGRPDADLWMKVMDMCVSFKIK